MTVLWARIVILPALMIAAGFVVLSCKKSEMRASVRTDASADTSAFSLLPRDFQRGVNYAHVHRRGMGYGSARSARELDSLRSIGVDCIAITPFGYQEGATSDRIVGYDGKEVEQFDRSLTDTDLLAEIDSAHVRGIHVMLKPQIWSHDFWNGGEWHGTIHQNSPAEHERWWRCYRAFVLHYAGVAERGRADLYCIGTELVMISTAYPEEWRALIADVRNVYRGKLTYAAHWDREWDSVAFWDDLDFIGINAYFPLDVPSGADLGQLVAAWKPHLERIERFVGSHPRPVLFTEVGYRPVKETFREPWRYSGGEPDPGAQALAYEALFRALQGRSWFAGIYLWKTFTDPTRAMYDGEDTGFTFRGRPAERIVRHWYGG